MRTKLGQVVPAELALALETYHGMLPMWDRLRPSCQRIYANLVATAKREETRKRRVARVLAMTAAYYGRHPSVSQKEVG